MGDSMLALGRSFATLASPSVWGLFLLPVLLALAIWGGLAWWGLGDLTHWLAANPPASWLAAWGFPWLADLVAAVGAWVAVLAAVFLTTILVAAVVVVPMLVDHIAKTDYGDLARLGSNGIAASVWNSVAAAAIFVVGWVVTWPLWLVPGMAFVLPVLWLGWLNYRTFAFDVLLTHASRDEWRLLKARHRGDWLLLGMTLCLLAYVPFVGLFVPALAALAYTHAGLSALRRLRNGAVAVHEARGRNKR